MNEKEILKKIYGYVEREEERYEELSHKAMNKGNMPAMMIHNAEFSVFCRVRMYIDSLQEN